MRNLQNLSTEDAFKYQDRILPAVSRSFALTIPRLPQEIRTSITNAYLLCRIADTIEDDINLSPEDVKYFHELFIEVLKLDGDVQFLSAALYPRLSLCTTAGERELIANMDKVVRVTRSLNDSKRNVLIRCVEVMCEQMPRFQHAGKRNGLKSLHELNHYCYAVAGVVGEMLTELFCNYSDEISLNHDELMRLAPSFGQGLQMTNILKDIWEDLEFDSCWLPRDVFAEAGYDLASLGPDQRCVEFYSGLERLIAINHGHLENAVAYSLLIPSHETGIRRFLLWNVNMAVRTLQRIYRNPGYKSGQDVKISKATLVGTIVATSAVVRSDALVRSLFAIYANGLPLDSVGQGYFEEAEQLSSF